MLDERYSSEVPRRHTRIKLIVSGVAILLVTGGLVAAIILTSTSSRSTSSSSSFHASTTAMPSSTLFMNGSATSNATLSNILSSSSNPETDIVALTLLAVGDWGSTTGKKSDGSSPGSCCKLYSKGPNAGSVDTSQPRYVVDYHAQEYVAQLMGMSADALKPPPARILGHGDNIYWNGVGKDDIQFRMTNTFENIYTAKSLSGIKWLNVAGNHDIGGSQYICGDDNDHFRECTSIDEMLTYLDLKFTLQAKYKSPNGDR
ncbi:Aste57867_2858 [Aphanomyces stellatus]|uniref:Aste57867_2858 protein n=1 Tax=Aphanomyces stellatus TaxID=120398 RepID=A0A485KAZ8_9STRA|nr:hypothetical protein As57867_002850 [Aphanomyces stellatus]VFT80045.1 Aste57867_2858 [Aphanomyces stellatus]